MNWIRSILRPRTRTAILLAVLGLCRPGMAQQVSLALLPPRSMEPPVVVIRPTQTSTVPEAPGRSSILGP